MSGVDAADPAARAAQRAVSTGIERLRALDVVLLDNSIREAATSAPLGHTVADKHRIRALIRDFGVTDHILATFAPDRFTVDDRFVLDLKERGDPMLGGHAFAALGAFAPGFRPHPSTDKLLGYGVPGAVINADISRRRRPGGPDDATRIAEIAATVRHLRERIPGRVLLNLSDLPDAFDDAPDFCAEVLRATASLPLDGVLFEDARGTRLPLHSAALVQLIRGFHPPPRWVLAHPHAGNGMEHASLLEAVLAGADGAWVGLLGEAAMIGHASGLVLLTNLLRAGNAHVAGRFRMETCRALAAELWAINRGEDLPVGHPVVGGDAYRATLPAFEQTDAPGDLPAEAVGQVAGARLVPAIATGPALARRLLEAGVEPTSAMLAAIRSELDQRLLSGEKRPWDEPDRLRELVAVAQNRINHSPPE